VSAYFSAGAFFPPHNRLARRPFVLPRLPCICLDPHLRAVSPDPPGRPHAAVTTSATWERHRQPYLTRYSNARIMIRHKGRSTGQLWEHKGNAGSLRIINSLLPNWGFGSCRLIDARPAAVTSLLIFRNRVFFAAPGPLADCITMREDLVRPHQSSTVRRTTILSSSATQRQNE
jgi:hypothetical protein